MNDFETRYFNLLKQQVVRMFDAFCMIDDYYNGLDVDVFFTSVAQTDHLVFRNLVCAFTTKDDFRSVVKFLEDARRYMPPAVRDGIQEWLRENIYEVRGINL